MASRTCALLAIMLLLGCHRIALAEETMVPWDDELAEFSPQFSFGFFKCIGGLVKVVGCLKGVKKAIKEKDYSELTKPCCQAISGITSGCWFIIFPGKPFVAAALKVACHIIPADEIPSVTYTD